jgi:hypothetical protein
LRRFASSRRRDAPGASELLALSNKALDQLAELLDRHILVPRFVSPMLVGLAGERFARAQEEADRLRALEDRIAAAQHADDLFS